MKQLQGSCACKKVQYSLNKKPIVVHCCHCRFCQRMSGSAFGLNAMIEADLVQLRGEEELERIPTPSTHPKGQIWARCKFCKVSIWSEHPELGKRIRIINAGTLDQAEALSPDVHCRTESKHPWITIPKGAHSYEQDYDSDVVWSDDAKNRIKAVFET